MVVTHVDRAFATDTVSFGWLRSLYASIIDARQRQADQRAAAYLRSLPVLVRLSLPQPVIDKLRKDVALGRQASSQVSPS